MNVIKKIGRQLINASGYSWQGLCSAWNSEFAFKLEIALSILFIPLALYFGDSAIERAALIGSWLLVPLVELLNSAIEAVVDRISTEPHPLSKNAKDYGSAAVFIAIINTSVIWLILTW